MLDFPVEFVYKGNALRTQIRAILCVVRFRSGVLKFKMILSAEV